MTAPSVATWRKRAACQGIDPEVFYPVSDEDAEEAKVICAVCPVRQACLEHAWPTASAKACGVEPPSASAVGSSGSVASRPEAPALYAPA